MFIDRVQITLVAGKGGNGVVAWRREKYIPKGGPCGGNGGRGGSVIFEGSSSLFSLDAFRHRRIRKAETGRDGGANLRQGRSGEDLIIQIPYGTLIKDAATQEVLFDCTPEGPKEWVACTGGRGGKGNNSFKSSTHQAPNICTFGQPGQELEVELELKLIADVGLVGMPNAGKSTLLFQLTRANVKRAPYPFTTLSPNLSFIDTPDYRRVLIADIPGIIENAHQNKGLGLAFLRHIERTSLLLFVIDVAGSEGRDPLNDFQLLRREIEEYAQGVENKDFLVVLNKIDHEGADEHLRHFIAHSGVPPEAIFPISALTQEGLHALIDALCLFRFTPSMVRKDEPACSHQG